MPSLPGPLAAALIVPLAVLGALMLVVPRRFEPLLVPALPALLPFLPVLGAILVTLSAALPWLWLRYAREVSLRARLALALCIAAGLPLVLGAAASARQQERAVVAAVTRLHEVVATSRASSLAVGIEGFKRAADSVARVPGLLDRTPEAQTTLLRTLSLTPNPRAVTTYRATGEPVARTDDRPLTGIAETELFREVRRTLAPAHDVVDSDTPGQPVFRIAAPALSADGQLLGLVVIELENLISLRPEAEVGSGARLILRDASGRPLARDADTAANSAAAEWIAGTAPVPRLGWTVSVERPAALALAPVRQARESIFAALAVALVLAALAGVWASRLLAGTLNALTAAAERLGEDEDATPVPLPRSRITEVARLARRFGHMREQLAARAAEREQIAGRMRLLLDAATTLTDATDIEPAIEQVLARASVASGADAAVVLVYDPDQESLLPRAAYAIPRERLAAVRLRAGDGLAGRAFSTGSAARFDHGQGGTALGPESQRLMRDVLGAVPESGLALPLRTLSGRTIGTVTFLCLTGHIAAADQPLLEGIAVQIAIALRNAELYAQAQGQARQLQIALAELRESQRQVIRQERLRAVGEMASGIAHDLNNALAPIVGFSELLLERPEELSNLEHVRRYLGMIHTGAEDAASIVRRLREVYRDRDETEPRVPVDLPSVVSQVVDMTSAKWRDQALAEGRTIRIRTELEPVPPLLGAEATLRELLTNLIFNAVDAMPEGGTITLRTSFDPGRERRAVGNGGWVALEVADTGIGMTPEVRERCMEPFFSTKGEHGTGLGLPMVHGIVRRYGGTFEIDSAVGRGTTFTLRFPAHDDDVEPSNLLIPTPRAALSVLVVDDDPLPRSVTVAYLESEGHRVESVESGLEALQRARAASFDLVITDGAMPGMTGQQLAAALKRHAPQLPVILLTGFGDLIAPGSEMASHVDLVLGKPLTLAKLREALDRVSL